MWMTNDVDGLDDREASKLQTSHTATDTGVGKTRANVLTVPVTNVRPC